MIDFLINLVESDNDFGNIGYYVLFYFGLLWFLFSVWVFFDAKKRYENPFVAGLFFVLVFVLNFPMLVFYLIIRPENEENYYIGPDQHHSALNIPIANFVNENGVAMSLNIKINHELLNQDLVDSDVKVDFSLKSDKIIAPEEAPKEESKKEEPKEKKPHFIKVKASNFKAKLKALKKEKKEEEKQEEKQEDKEDLAKESEPTPEVTAENTSSESENTNSDSENKNE